MAKKTTYYVCKEMSGVTIDKQTAQAWKKAGYNVTIVKK